MEKCVEDSVATSCLQQGKNFPEVPSHHTRLEVQEDMNKLLAPYIHSIKQS